MKVTKEKSRQNRASLIRSASKLFCERGIDDVSVAEIGEMAGLTHGAIYAHFASKDELAAAALADGLDRIHARRFGSEADAVQTIQGYLDFFISKRHRDNISLGCPIAASGSEAARQDANVSRAFAEGFKRAARNIEAVLEDCSLTASSRERAIAIHAAEIGAMIVARGVAKADPKLSDEVLSACRRVLGEIGGEDRA